MGRTITLRNVPDEVVRSLRARARKNRRSMQGELLSIVAGTIVDREALERQVRECRARVSRPMRIEEIHQAISEGRS